MSQLMPLSLTVSCFSKIQIGFTFLVPAHPGSPIKEPLNGCVGVCLIKASAHRPLLAYNGQNAAAKTVSSPNTNHNPTLIIFHLLLHKKHAFCKRK